jgi:dolichyl-phosphate-mannose-protein mannosyltransferase
MNAGTFLFWGWLLHFFPFFLMGRELFLHHYLPALYFSILLTGALFDVFARRVSAPVRWLAAALFAGLVITVFVQFAPLAYGLEFKYPGCKKLQWRPSWDFGCEYSKYLIYTVLRD